MTEDISNNSEQSNEPLNDTEKSVENQIEKPWLFQKGQSGNPAGKPKGTISFDTAFQRAVKLVAKRMKAAADKKGEEFDEEGFDADAEIIARGMQNLLKGKERSLELMLDRRFGKVKQTIEMDSRVEFDPAQTMAMRKRWFPDEDNTMPDERPEPLNAPISEQIVPDEPIAIEED